MKLPPPNRSPLLIRTELDTWDCTTYKHIRPVGFVFGLWSEHSSMDKHLFMWANIRPWTNTSRNRWRIFMNGTNTPSEYIRRIFVHGMTFTEWIPYQEHEANIYPWNEYPRKNIGRILVFGKNTLSKVWGEHSRPWTTIFSKMWGEYHLWTTTLSKRSGQ